MDIFTELKKTKSLLESSMEKLEDDNNKEAKEQIASADKKITEVISYILNKKRIK